MTQSQVELARVNGTESASSNAAGIIQSLWGSSRQAGKPATGLLAVLLFSGSPTAQLSVAQRAESIRVVCAPAVPPLCRRCVAAVSPLCRRRVAAVSPLCRRCAAAVSPLCRRFVAALPPLCRRFAAALPPLCRRSRRQLLRWPLAGPHWRAAERACQTSTGAPLPTDSRLPVTVACM